MSQSPSPARLILAHGAGIALYVVLGFAMALAYLYMHKHGLGRRGGWELSAVIFFLPMVALAGGVLLVAPLVALHYLKGWAFLSPRMLLALLAGAFAISFIWGGGLRIFSMRGAPPLAGWFMAATIMLTGCVHLWLARWADKARMSAGHAP